MVMHHSRNSPTGSRPRYLTSTAVLVVEVVKLSASLLLATYDTITSHSSSSSTAITQHLYRSIFAPDSWKLIVPAALYTLQNSLVYTAISNLDAVTFQVTYQLKILTTVLFSILLLGRTISLRQWLGLLLLTFGVALVQLSPTTPDVNSATSWTNKITSLFTSPSQPPAVHHNALKGLAAVVGASLISGLTCVYFEKILKDSLGSNTSSIWIRNVQLSFFSIFPALFIGVIWYDGANIAQNGGFFAGYNAVVWATVCLQALGGLIVAVCIAYADNVVKNFAASLSIVVSYAGTAVVFGERMTLHVGFLFLNHVPMELILIIWTRPLWVQLSLWLPHGCTEVGRQLNNWGHCCLLVAGKSWQVRRHQDRRCYPQLRYDKTAVN